MSSSVAHQQPPPPSVPHHPPQPQRPLLPAVSHLPTNPSTLFLSLLVLGITTVLLLFHRYRHSILHFLSPESDPRPLTKTEQNTERNRTKDGRDLPPGATLSGPRRRGLRHRSFSDLGEEEEEEKGAKGEEEFKMVSKPVPAGVKSCFKRSASPLPSSASPSLPQHQPQLDTPSRSDTPSPTPRKTVRVVDPSSERASLEALREFWAAPGVHGAGGGGGSGIAGYRRTRDIYAKGQGGTAVIKRGVVKVNEGPSPSAGEEGAGGAGTESETTTSDDSGAETSTTTTNTSTSKLERRRSPRLSIPSSVAARSSSLSPSTSPSPTSRLRASSSPTSSTHRTASPSPLVNSTLHATTTGHARAASPSFIVGKTARGASPSPARMQSRKRTGSREGGVGGKEEGAVGEAPTVTPRWVRNKEGKGKGVAAIKAAGGDGGEKDIEQQASAEEQDDDQDDGFEDVSASDVSGSSTPVLEPVLLPPLDGVVGEGSTSNLPPTSPPSTESPPPSSTSSSTPSLAAASISSPPPTSTSTSTSSPTTAPEPRYPLRSRESTPIASPSSKPPPSLSSSSSASSNRRGSITLSTAPTTSTGLLLGTPTAGSASPGRGKSASSGAGAGARGVVVVL